MTSTIDRIRARVSGVGLAALMLGSVALGGCSTAATTTDKPIDESLLAITDCRALEEMASAEVDRINATTDQAVIDAARARFEHIVARRDQVC